MKQNRLSRGIIVLSWLLFAVLAAAVLFVVMRVLSWPLAHDAPVLQYVAQQILAGQAPYRDLMENNFPGTYLLHMLQITLFGESDAGWVAFNLLYLALFLTVHYRLVRRVSNRAALWSGLLFCAVYFSFGAFHLGQRDFLMTLFTAAAGLVLIESAERGLRPAALFACGALGAFSAMIKPYSVIYLLLLFALLALFCRQQKLPFWGRAALLALGAAAVGAAIFAWLAADQSLAAFWDIGFNLVLGVYNKTLSLPLIELLALLIATPVIFVTALFVLPFVRRVELPSPTARRVVWLVLCGIFYGLCHYLLQGKGYSYHSIPLLYFVLALLGILTDRLLAAPRLSAQVAAFAALLCLVLVYASTLTLEGLRDSSLTKIRPVVPQLEADLNAMGITRDDRVQVLDGVVGGLHVLYRLHLRQPTRFLYDFPLLLPEDSPYRTEQRRAFLQELTHNRTAAIVAFHKGFLPDQPVGLARFAGFPELVDFWTRQCTPAAVREDYTLFDCR